MAVATLGDHYLVGDYMRDTLFEVIDEVEISISSGTQKDFSVRSSVKDIPFEISILKYKKADSLTEVLLERDNFKRLNTSEKISLDSNIKISDPTQERMELHLLFEEDPYSPKRFCFDLGSKWIWGGRIYIRKIW